MKKWFLFFILIICSSTNLYPPTASADNFGEESIYRSIITKIKWNKELHHIDVYKIMLQKVKDTAIQVYETIEVVDSTEFSEQTVLSDKEAYKYAHELGTLDLSSDIIFGKKVAVFKDLSGQENLTQEEINRWIELAKEQIEKDYVNPPAIQNEKEESSLANAVVYFIIYGLPIIFLLFLLLFVKKIIKIKR